MVRTSTTRTTASAATDREMLRLIAELYYERELRQPEIAELTGFSVSKVSRLLTQAREQGIIRISIEPPLGGQPEIADAIGEQFGVAVTITPGRELDPSSAARVCGLAAADAIVGLVPAEGAIGLAGGYTMAAMASALPRLDRPGLSIVPVVGGWDARNRYLDVNELARRVADRLGAQVQYLHAPGMLDSQATKEALLRDSAVAATTAFWTRLQVALLGVSGGPSLHPGYGTVMDRLDDDHRTRLVDLGVVGDVSGHLIREDGTIVDDEWSRRTIAISVEDLRRVPMVVAIAAGSNKVRSLRGTLRTGLVHHLITDRLTAEGIVRRSSRGVR
ncbi:MAG: sugar-binding domain-containing protein [Chloroflexota bacterium]